MRYGLGYRGSKSRIAPELVEHLPCADVFVDLFAGGCAVTHAAMLSGRYRRFVANDCTGMPELFRAAAEGRYRDETRWISREDFQRLKDTDLYVKTCWSFGNNGRNYLYGADIEPYKEALHHAVFFRDFALVRRRMPCVAAEVERRLTPIEDRRLRRVEIGRAIVDALNALPPR